MVEVKQLQQQLAAAARDQRVRRARMNGHRQINEATNHAVLWWSTLEVLAVLACAIFQILYVRRIFEHQRRI